MIHRNEISAIGEFLKPHGIKGEISAQLDIEISDIDNLSCIVCEMDGIPVPFFISSFRSNGAATALLSIDGINNETEASSLAGKTIYAKSEEIQVAPDADGLYVSDMIGFRIIDQDGKNIGIISDIDDSTTNILFIVSDSDGKSFYIPAAEDLITNLDLNAKSISMDLPEGLIDN